MRYLLLFVGGGDDERMDADARAAMYRACEGWFRRHGDAGHVTGGYHLAPPDAFDQLRPIEG